MATTSSQWVATRRIAVETRPRTDEEPAVGPGGGQGEAAFEQGPDLGDEGHDAGALAFGALVDQPAGRGGGLAAHGPEPPLGVDVDTLGHTSYARTLEHDRDVVSVAVAPDSRTLVTGSRRSC
ncbi:hypothetical protein [Pseudonocardia charpentierae]|uniref:Uncharacterized protein n=1 Tax=Pseudonocardia charpentierae TaxID=3075545 RepID=A0ABU2NGZ7_9PSEU|nr:hypothetical protein [Pseudonocardia sp. DSM 45834]MDT0353041.1 hypothetical protein [Pseudonocardia sp. DSM 45834]